MEGFLAWEIISARFCEKQGRENSITGGLEETGCLFLLYFENHRHFDHYPDVSIVDGCYRHGLYIE